MSELDMPVPSGFKAFFLMLAIAAPLAAGLAYLYEHFDQSKEVHYVAKDIDGLEARLGRIKDYVDSKDRSVREEFTLRMSDAKTEQATLRAEVRQGFSEQRKVLDEILLRLPRKYAGGL